MTLSIDFGFKWQGVWIHLGDMELGLFLGFISIYIVNLHLLERAASLSKIAMAAMNEEQQNILEEWGKKDNVDIDELCRAIAEKNH